MAKKPKDPLLSENRFQVTAKELVPLDYGDVYVDPHAETLANTPMPTDEELDAAVAAVEAGEDGVDGLPDAP